MQNNSQLLSKRAIYNILGSMCNKPSLLFTEGKELNVDDFYEDFYKILYGTINNIIINNPNVEKITPVDIDNSLAENTKLYKIYELNDGMKYVKSCIENANVDLYEQNYDLIKKFSLLRNFNSNGISVKDILDMETMDLEYKNKQYEKFEKMTLEEIINHINTKFVNIKNDWDLDGISKSYSASDDLDSLLGRLKENPDYGISFMNKYYNTIFRGMRRGKLLIRSAGTGGSKTRNALADLVMACCDEIYDMELNRYVKNGKAFGGTFISTELELQELQTCLLAIISGVNELVIKEGKYNQEIEQRLLKAIEIVKRSKIFLHYIPDFTVSEIEQLIEKDILLHNVQYVWFDYIQSCSKLAKSTSESYGGLIAREDQILVQLSSSLKQIADKYNVFMGTATQLNRNAKEHDNRDTTSIRGGSSIIDKANFATMMFRATEKDHTKLEHILKTGKYKKPNFCHYVYKNRDGYNNLIVWTQMNLGNMREVPCFVTNFDYELLTDIQPMTINIDETSENFS